MIKPFQGRLPSLADGVYVDESAVVIGDVAIGTASSVWPLVAVRGDVNHIRIGARTNVQDNSTLHVTAPNEHQPAGYPLIIGDEVTVGHGCILHACTIGNRCLIGMGSTLLDGAVIEDQVLLGAGSLVPPGKVLEGGYLWLGSPVKRMRALTSAEIDWFTRSATNYVALKNHYMA